MGWREDEMVREGKVYSLLEKNDLYSKYERVALEDCLDEFMTAEEYNDLPESAKPYCWSGGATIVINVKAMRDLVASAAEQFKKRDAKRKTIAFPLDTEMPESVYEDFKERLEKRGLKYTGGKANGRVREDPKKNAPKWKKDQIRRLVADTIEIYVKKEYQLDVEFHRQNQKDNQVYNVLFAIKAFGLTLESLLEWKKEHKKKAWYGEDDIKEADGLEWAKEWWKKIKDGDIYINDDGDVVEKESK